MPLLALWTSNPIAVGEFSIEQVVATAGDGLLRDGSVCSGELRQYLSQVPTHKIAVYVDQCLGSSLNKGGLILQDLINEIGRRLDFTVTNGRYQGVVSAIGYDGIWLSPEGHSIIAEVKTTDAYRMSLDTLAGYRDRLAAAGQVSGPSSVLIIVGRQDTGELEAQIRGSRHAWDVRLISAEALLKLVQLKENADGPETGRKIRSLLAPMEYTRLDRMIDVMFTTATDVEKLSAGLAEPEVEDRSDEDRTPKSSWEFTDSTLLQRKRESIITAVGRDHGAPLIRKSRALFWSADHEVRAACTVSKRYLKRNSYPYWYAFHPQWAEFLNETKRSYFVLGCMDLKIAFAIPGKEFVSHLDGLNVTIKDDGSRYWHVHLVEKSPGSYAILLPKKSDYLRLDDYVTKVT
ncbi:hypothetical protein [Methylobacterium sp. SI9]|uniref:hypothetical protein n=1 Tax=Methylobacterium guangdongense TaxID=3138811 RepID=UPI00313DD401